MQSDSQPRCNACEHFHITFERNFRYGCRALGFKSQRLPERDVIESSGLLCQFFEVKRRRQ